jgi:hypothetical protein
MLADITEHLPERTRQEMVAGKRAIRRAGQVEYIEALCKADKIKVRYGFEDVVYVDVLSEPPKGGRKYRARYQGRVTTVTLQDSGEAFPSNQLIASLRLIFE